MAINFAVINRSAQNIRMSIKPIGQASIGVDTTANPSMVIQEDGNISFCLSPTEVIVEPSEIFRATLSQDALGSSGLILIQVGSASKPVVGDTTIDWADGTEAITISAGQFYQEWRDVSPTLVGTRQLTISGNLGTSLTVAGTKLKSIDAFGDINCTWYRFYGEYEYEFSSPNLISVPAVLPPSVTSLRETFKYCLEFNQYLPWNTINVTDMFATFLNGSANDGVYNQPLDTWDVRNVVDFEYFLWRQTVFNQDLSNWCVPLVTSEPFLFSESTALIPEHKPVWGTCPVPIDPSWDYEYKLSTSSTPVRTLGSTGTDGKIINTMEPYDVDKSTIEYVIINRTVYEIGSAVFRTATTNLATSLTLPTSLRRIGSEAFYNWNLMTSLVVPEGVTSIGQYAFSGWTSCLTAELPSTLNLIETRFMANLSSLVSLTCRAVVPPTYSAFDNDPFQGLNPSASIYVPAGSVDAYKAAFGWSLYANRIFAIP